MEKIFILALMIIISNFLLCITYDFDIKQDGTGDYTTVSAALASIVSGIQPDDVLSINIFPNIDENQNPIVTTYYDAFTIPSCTFTLQSEVPEVYIASDYVIIDSYYEADDLYGKTAIRVLPDDFVTNKSFISGLTIQRSGSTELTRDDSGIVALSKCISIYDCKFGSRANNNNFKKSIYYITNPNKSGSKEVKIVNNIFNEACNLGEYTVLLESYVTDYETFNALINDNQFIDCGKGINIKNSTIYHIEDNIFDNLVDFSNSTTNTIDAIQVNSTANTPLFDYIENNFINNYECGIASVSSSANHYINNNRLINTSKGIIASGAPNFQVNKNLIYCDFLNDSINELCAIEVQSPALLSSNTLFSPSGYANSIAIKACNNSLISSSILKNFNDVVSVLPGQNVDIEYSCLEDISTQPTITYKNGNINNEPAFQSENPLDETFCHLSENSPCIETGNPHAPLDPDGTFADMGFTYYHHDGYSHLFDDGIHWVSFPVLNEQEYYTGFSDYYEQAYTENFSAGIFQDYATNALTIDGFTRIDGKRINQQLMDIQFDNANFDDNEFNNMLFRHEGYQITIDDSNQETPFTTYGNLYDNAPLPSQLDMDTGEYHWLGYWLLESKNIVEAFGNFWEGVEKIKSQDWYYDRQSIIRGRGGAIKPSQETEGKVMEYGKAYMVWFKGDPFVTPPITGFQWDDNSQSSIPLTKSIPENFEFTEKTNYEAIDLLNIPADVEEIGVFENEICLGAVVVQDSSEQVLVYSDAVNIDAGHFTFELFTGARFTEKIKKYKVLNFRSGEFEAKPLTAGRNEYSVIRFNSDNDDNSEETLLKTEVFNNYPNPFNPTTTISFNLGTEQKIELDIYNSKGQKVKKLYSATTEKGKHSIVWNGTDSNNKTVSSGVYLYKLKTQQETFNRKMLLMK